MTAPSSTRIDNDTTPMAVCPSCEAPIDINGNPASIAYIHRVESERREAEEIIVQLLLALEPFAAMANRYEPGSQDSQAVLTWQEKPVVSLGDLRRAKALVDQY